MPGKPCLAGVASPALLHVHAWQPCAAWSMRDISSSIITTTLHHVLLSAGLFSSKEQKATCSLQPDG